MLTVGQINEKISELRSKVAVTEGVVLYLKTHYMPSEADQAEMHFTRSDYGKVPPTHVERTIADYVDYLDGVKAELVKLECMPVAPEVPKLPQPRPQPKPAQRPPVRAVASNGKPTTPAKPARKETSSGATTRNQDQPAPQQPAGGKAG